MSARGSRRSPRRSDPVPRGWWACGLGLLLLAPLPAPGAEAPETIDPSAPCVSSKCHAEILERRYVHWSDLGGTGECQKCHRPSGARHEFGTDDSNDACLACHEELGKRIATAQTAHEAMEDGCLECHDPHAADAEYLLAGVEEDEVAPLCFGCHEDDILKEEFKHGPADEGACNECHDPHASSISPLLKQEIPGLCGECHDDIIDDIQAAESVHDPAEDSCTDCHSPHSGPAPRMLPAEGRELCNECHDDIVETAENSEVDHAATTTGDECLNCHSPHAGHSPANLLEAQPDLCLGCHDKRLRSGERNLINMKQWLSENSEWHQPIRKKGCTACHGPHGGDRFRLLEKEFPPRFYAGFRVQAYALCFSCHERTLATVRRTRSLTGFRDGDRNLHFVHVNRSKGRTCRACHDMHASSNARLIRRTVRFGRWSMPIKYQETETGGSCRPGCHRRRSYDRQAGKVAGER